MLIGLGPLNGGNAAGGRPLMIDAMLGAVQELGAYARSNKMLFWASASSEGVVARAYP